MQDGSSSSSLLSCGRRNVNKRASIPACTQTRHFLFLLAERFGSVFCARSLSLSLSLSLSFSFCGAQSQAETEPKTEPQGNRDMRSEEGPGGAGGGGGPRLFDFFL